jgi:hypothetical protein
VSFADVARRLDVPPATLRRWVAAGVVPVPVTDAVREAGGPHLDFDHIGQVTLKGFREPTELFVARGPE